MIPALLQSDWAQRYMRWHSGWRGQLVWWTTRQTPTGQREYLWQMVEKIYGNDLR